jgi:hypothetical protein
MERRNQDLTALCVQLRMFVVLDYLHRKQTVFTSSLISEDTNKTSAIVLSLVEPLLGRGHTLWIDNFCNAPALAWILKSMKVD